ncbi:MAG TPA: CRISPR system precrRNA processing endoribonuclease RAMP protein Cas6, partial [Ktedonobacteraceae bacterium]|nr:CRISPR system precrRNA processing endoribonuclease RAMP protein Cas6 [Ktedonobacteraceae bacterium]
MDGPFAFVAPARLYAFLLKLRPVRPGTLMPFSGELVHGAWLHWLRCAAPDVATWLHDGNRRRFFTCSSLQFPVSQQRALEAERENEHLPLDPQQVYVVRITLLLGELFPLFYAALMRFNTSGTESGNAPCMQIGRQLFRLEEVVLNNDDPSGWTGFTSLSSLVEKTKRLRLSPVQLLTLEFASLTTFNRNNMRSKSYGPHYARLPLPQYVFPGLLRRWEDIAPPELVDVVQRELIEQYIKDDGVIVADYDLKTHRLKFTTHQQQGFIGTCKYHLRGPDEERMTDSALSLRQQLFLLARLAFYCGVGYKTSMGMGRTRPLEMLQLARCS